MDGRKRAAIVIIGGGRTTSVATPGILKKTPTPVRPGGSTGEGKRVRWFDDTHHGREETRPKRKKHGRDECEVLEETAKSTRGLKPKKRKRELDDGYGAPQQKKLKVGRNNGKTAVETATESFVKQKNHGRKKRHAGKKKHTPDSGVDHGLLKISNSSKLNGKSHKQKRKLDHLGPQSKNEAVDEDITTKSSSSPASHEAPTSHEVPTSCEAPTSREAPTIAQYDVAPLSTKGKKKSKVKMHSGVVAVEEVKAHRKRKKRERGYSPTVLLQRAAEVGLGQETTWI